VSMQVGCNRFPVATGGFDTHMQFLDLMFVQPVTERSKVIGLVANRAIVAFLLLQQFGDNFFLADIDA
jgi:hypothetical protein